MIIDQEWLQERIAIRHFDGGLSEELAEKKALEDVSRYPQTVNEGSEE